MSHTPSPKNRDAAVSALAERAAKAKSTGIKALFEADSKRFDDFSERLGELFLDYSKTTIDQGSRDALFDLARLADLEGRRDAMFAGEAINTTEDRSVLHVALRGRPADGYRAGKNPVSGAVEEVLAAMSAFAEDIRSGSATGARDSAITDVVNIGIGGSDLGPAMATLALAPITTGHAAISFRMSTAPTSPTR